MIPSPSSSAQASLWLLDSPSWEYTRIINDRAIGRYIVEALTRKLSIIGPRVISVDVRWTMKAPRHFFRHLGFEIMGAVLVIRRSSPDECLRRPCGQVHPDEARCALSRYESFHPHSPVLGARCLYTAALCGRLSGYAFWEQDNIHGYLLLHHHIIMDARP